MAQAARQFVEQKLNELGIADKKVLSRWEYVVRGFAAKLTDKQLNRVKNSPMVKLVDAVTKYKVLTTAASFAKPFEPAHKRSNTASSGQITPWNVSRAHGPLNGVGLTVWILGTGIDLTHPDLDVNRAESVSFVANESADDEHGHGTYVAGILAAQNNDSGVVGVAAGASVVAVKVVNEDGFGTDADFIDGINYVANNASNSDIVNISLRYPPNNAIDLAVTNAANSGIRVVIAAGNGAQHASNISPARVDHANVWTVSAFRQGDEFVVDFDCQTNHAGSNFGNPPIDYSAGGEDVTSLLIGGGRGLGYASPYNCTDDGTSYAAPIVSGLLLAAPNDLVIDGYVSNDPDGNPDPILVKDLPLKVYITGPVFLSSGETGTWTAHVQNNERSVSYKWYRNTLRSSSWQFTGDTDDTYSTYFYNGSSQSQNAGVRVKVFSAGENASATRTVTVSPAGCSSSSTTSNSVSTNRPPPCNG